MNISQSQINLFGKCPYGYALRYLYKKEPIMFDPSIVEVGSRVHEAINTYYRNHLLLDGTEEQIKDKVYSVLRNDWDTTLPVEFLKKAYICISNFAKFEYSRKKGRRGVPLTETKIYSDGLMGIIDYLDLNNLDIVDFKTNTKASVSYDNKVQAVMYKMLVKEEYDIDLQHFTLQYLYTNEHRVVEYDKNIFKIEGYIKKIVKEIKNAWDTGEFPKNPKTPKMCNWCEYRYYCKGGNGHD